MQRPWLIADPEPYEEYDLGPLKTGKEAEVFLVERVAPDGRSCLLAHKRYRPRDVAYKGELQALGFQTRRELCQRPGVPGRPHDRQQPRPPGDRQAIAPRKGHASPRLARQRIRDVAAARRCRCDGALPGRAHRPTASSCSTSVIGRWPRRGWCRPGWIARASRTPPCSCSRTWNGWRARAWCTRTSRSTTCCGGRTSSGSSTFRKRSTSPRTAGPSSSCIAIS